MEYDDNTVSQAKDAWNITPEELRRHIQHLPVPDQLYWNSRALRHDGQKFLTLPWSVWRPTVKVDGHWRFADTLYLGENFHSEHGL